MANPTEQIKRVFAFKYAQLFFSFAIKLAGGRRSCALDEAT